ncbi:hypothetical protein QJS10_CPA01g01825 [Acorus calamus]|uniref:FAR1 domain-containing protein n=1 Tax=Acorus calamus TaxID=4465 RepID=A0AAV9FJW7_ACOCL|nr:hypothetical protein QJS10_CPA01g01825 [Acorus calamus]
MEWVKHVGRNIGVVVVIGRSDVSEPRRAPRVILICERGGKYDTRPRKTDKGKQKRQTGIKKCECPFKLRAYEWDGKWRLEVMCGLHNHPLAMYFTGHSYAGKLLEDEVEVLQVKINNKGRKRRGKKWAKALVEESTKREKSGFEHVLESLNNSIQPDVAVLTQTPQKKGEDACSKSEGPQEKVSGQ